MSIFHKYSVTQVLYFLLGVFITGFLLVILIGGLQIQKIMMHGPIYQQVNQGKNLVADILPPPSYIIESYLNVLELETEKDPARIHLLITRAHELKNIYEENHERWKKELEEGELFDIFLGDSHASASSFFAIRDNEFIPSLEANEPSGNRKLVLGRMKFFYDSHRKSIDRAVELATLRNKLIETNAADSVSRAISIMLSLSLIFLALFTYLYHWVVKAEAENRVISAHVDELEMAKIQLLNQKSQLELCIKELESFSYSVSHDLRAPLRGIDGWSLALLEDYKDSLDERGNTYLTRVRSETQRMGELIDDLLKLSQLSRAEVNWERVNLSQIANDISERLREENPKRSLIFVIQPGLETVGDARLLEIVLTNLLSNACKFTSKNQVANIEFGKVPDYGKNTYFIRDDGAGFNMSSAKNLFGTFERMHKQAEFPGTGIGLATVKRIITLHLGQVWADAEVNRGATFYFSI